jgi:ligand-binding SRPBCC domain-containing protein
MLFHFVMALATCMATHVERRRRLRVDTLIPDALFTSTHAITIEAPPELVWPWIAQMGGGRAGWYSWDVIDNGGTPSATRVLSELQTVVPGDVMPAVPGATDAFVVARVDAPRDLVLTVPDGHGGFAVAWEHVLDPLENGRTRLVVRGRTSSRWLDLARATPPAGHRRIFIERAYAVLASLPRPLLIGFASVGHRLMEARHLRGIRSRSTAAAARATLERWPKPLLSCGILAALLYIAMTLFVGMSWKGYSLISQAPSELSAIGAPTRPVWIFLSRVYAGLMMTFAWMVWKSASSNRALRVVAVLLMSQTMFGAFWPPMHQRMALAAGGGTLTDTLHLVWALVTGVIFTLAMGFGAAALGKRFRAYSIATMTIVLASGAWAGTYTSRLQANLPTPGMGVWERINIAAFMVWIAVLATALLRASHEMEANHVTPFVQDS